MIYAAIVIVLFVAAIWFVFWACRDASDAEL